MYNEGENVLIHWDALVKYQLHETSSINMEIVLHSDIPLTKTTSTSHIC